MNRVVFEEVDQVVDIHEGVVDSSNAGIALSEAGAEDETTNTAESIDTHTNSAHLFSFVCLILIDDLDYII